MRRVFEEFLQFKSSSEITPTQNQRSKVENIIIQSTEGKKIDNVLIEGDSYLNGSKKTKLGKLLTAINVLSHKANRNPDEIHQSAKFMMKLIEDMDKAHFVAMKQ